MVLKRNRKILIGIVLLLLAFPVVFLLCSKEEQKEILIGGSTTVQPYTKMLAEEYMKRNKSVHIVYEGGGSTPGLIAVKNGSIDIASSSRDLTDDEDDENTYAYMIGKDGVGIVVNPANPIASLTIDQVKDIFSGKIESWSDMSGDNTPITVISRNAESTTLKGFSEIVLKGEQVTDNAVIAGTAEEVSKAVAENPAAIGLMALKDINSNVKVLKINGTDMNKATILSGRYPLTRSFYFVVYDKTNYKVSKYSDKSAFGKLIDHFTLDESKKQQIEIDTINRFLQFVASADGQDILEKAGAIAVY
jgi:phosphate transport system substrate-binding protein